MSTFNPHSSDSMFSLILQRLDKQDGALERIELQTTKTNGRVTKLEKFKTKAVAVYGALTAVVGAVLWAFEKGHIKL